MADVLSQIRVLKDYRIDGLLSQDGSYGVIFDGEQITTGRKVVIKILTDRKTFK